jgi:integrase
VARKPRDDQPKAPNGAGSCFYSPAADAWFASYSRGLDAKRQPIVKRFRAQTEEDARRKRDADRTRWEHGLDTTVDVEALTVRDLVDRYLGAVRRGDATMRRHARNARLHVCPDKPTATSIGHVPLGRLREDHLARLYAGVADRPALAAQLHATCHAVLAWAVKRRRWLDQNVADFVEPPAYDPPELHPPSPAQIDAFFVEAARVGNRMLSLWWFLSLTGCRPSEALGCEWRDVEDGEWWVRRSRSTETTRIQPIKTKEPRRVALGETLSAILREHRKHQIAEIEAAGDAWEDNGLVFATMAGRPLRWSNLKQSYYYPLARSLHLAFSPYVFFRHAAVTQMLAAGVPIQDVSFRTGHSIETIKRHYAHRVRERDEAAVVALEKRIVRKRETPAETAVEEGS